MSNNLENELDVAYDHYKTTVEQVKKKEKDRDSLFIYLLLALSVALLFSIKPIDCTYILNSYIQSKMELNVNIEPYFHIVEMFLWAILFYISLRYFQRVISIKNKINYMRELEKEIDKSYFSKRVNFCRDSDFYDQNSSNLTGFARIFYSFLFPIGYFAIVFVKIIQQIGLIIEIKSSQSIWSLGSFLILIMHVLIAILLCLYMQGQIKLQQKYNKEKCKEKNTSQKRKNNL